MDRLLSAIGLEVIHIVSLPSATHVFPPPYGMVSDPDSLEGWQASARLRAAVKGRKSACGHAAKRSALNGEAMNGPLGALGFSSRQLVDRKVAAGQSRWGPIRIGELGGEPTAWPDRPSIGTVPNRTPAASN